MNAARTVQIAAEPPLKAAGRVPDQRRRDLGQEFEAALTGADAGKEKPETEVSEAPAEEALPNTSRSVAALPGMDVAPKAVAASGNAGAPAVPGEPASPDAAKSWNAAASLRLASILAAQAGDTPRSDPAVSAGLAGQARLEEGAPALPKTRVGVIAMATHFEPGAREPQLVPGKAEDAPVRGAPIIAAAAAAAAGVARASADKAGADRPLAADREGQGSEKATAKTDAPREAALPTAGAADGKSPGDGSETGRRGERKAPAGEQAASHGSASAIAAPPMPHQAQQAEPVAAASSVGGQVAERVSLALAPLAEHPSASGQADAMLRFKAGGGALRSIQIQLQPENLGTVDVSMRLINGQLAIELVTSEADTARTLSQDSEALRAVLEKAGFSVDEAAISIVARDHAPARPGQASPATPSDGQGGFDQSRHDGNPAEENGERRQQAKEASAGRPMADAGEASLRRSERGSSVYI